MKLDNFISLYKMRMVSGLFFATGSFGVIDGDVDYAKTENGNVEKYIFNNGEVEFVSEFTKYKSGVVIRRDTFKNVSSNDITVNRLVSRFRLKGNKYQVYTQFNGWQHENEGGFQNLVTEVSVASRGIRTCEGATPMLALLNDYTEKSVVFHLLPNCQWKMTAKKLPVYNSYETVVIETGFNDEVLNMKVKKGEIIFLPEVVFFEVDSKVDFDGYKLHEVYNELYPRRKTPVLYNSWLYCFDYLNVDDLLKQVDTASELGVEAFMVDAGWFGNGSDWFNYVGDWQENQTAGTKGRLVELSEYVRDKGMIFGLWLEPERAGSKSQVLKSHPEYFFDGKFFDFTNETARNYLVEVVCNLIEKYSIGWLKFDFNDTVPYDKTGNAFYYYLQGQKAFVKQIQDKYPNVYLTNCASGGYRMELNQASYSDSFWFTDNQGPYEGLRIIKDGIKRLPSNVMERWCVQAYVNGLKEYGNPDSVGRMIYCNNGTWEQLINVSDNYAKAFLTGGPIGFSCDIASLPNEYKQFWKQAVLEFKKDREIYKNGTARILVDDKDLTVIEYVDKNKKQFILQVFSKIVHTCDLVVYPSVEETSNYQVNGEIVSGEDLLKNGVTIDGILQNDCKVLRIVKL